ncbi:MAG: chromosome segregation protein SMC [Clostridiales bacterium]|nr:chromosome segregation protein SMC [Clostridiales bacterium]
MYLKKLELQGFKSFPEYTCIDFDRGLTAVVGPNGSGKSNISDAVRWVLGEQSVKQLRGGKMEDVIFNGTSARRSMNYAEVSITFDNSDGYIDYGFPEICITRRLYRSGESEYQINKVNCRLKDITVLFLDTGLGRDGYSLVGQGRVDDILSTKSEDRRRVIEEASGIVKYRVRKDEAQRKLATTEQNLVRINDILGELEDRKGPLEEQAGKARKFNENYEELKKLETSLLVHKITEANKEMGDSAGLKEQLEKEIGEREEEYLKLRKSHQEIIEKSEALDNEIEDRRQELSDLTEYEHEAQTDKKVSIERLNQTNQRIEELKSDMESADETVDKLTKELEEKKAKADSLLREADEAKTLSETLDKERQAKFEEYENSRKEAGKADSKVKAKTEELFETRKKITECSAGISAMEDKIRDMQEARAASESGKAELGEALEKEEKSLAEIRKIKSDVTNDIDVRNKKLEELRGRQVELNQFFEVNNKKLSAEEAKLRTLKDVDRNKEGYQESVRRLMEFSESDRLVKKLMVGILGDLIETDSKYETAIETALGNALNNIVTRSEADAAELIGILKEKRLGRITFLPIENIRARYIDEDDLRKAKGVKGYIGVAADLVRSSRDLEDIVSNLLGRILVADDLDAARNIASRTGRAYKVMTLEGDSVNPGGSLTGGSIRKTGAGTGIIGRKAEIESLTKSVAELEAKLSDSEDQRQEVDDGIGTLKRELAQLGEQLKFYQLEEVKAEGEYNNTKVRLEETEETLAHFDENMQSVSKSKLRLEEDMEEFSRIENDISGELADYREEIEEQQRLSEEQAVKLEQIVAKVREAASLAERKLTERSGILELAGHIRKQIEEAKQGRDRFESAISEAKETVKSITKEINGLDAKLDTNAKQQKVLEEKISALFEKRAAVSGDLSSFGDRLAASRNEISDLQTKLNNHVSKFDKIIFEIDQNKNRLWEDYETTYDNIKDSVEPVTKIGEQTKRIQTLKNAIKALGPVNLGALQEFSELSERLDFMTKQRDDIEAAKKDLEQVIEELLTKMRSEFTGHFETINKNFGQVFTDLFGGGTAEIILGNDSEDVLECAIDIKAQPPGKKLQNLSLLSGGERCLTAIGLLFAIQELKPSPFVILDEVEAALDDVNITRFTDFVRRHSARSQFILVTHRKGTMEACDQMYGVTMAERGVSKILSMELK